MQILNFAIIIAAALPLSSAHYLFPHLIVGNTVTPEWAYVRRSTQGYQPNFGDRVINSAVMRCNTGSENSGPNTGVMKVKAGDQVGFQTNLNGKIEHPGPLQIYMSKAPNGDVKTYDGSGGWFKVLQLGYRVPFTPKGDNWDVWGKSKFTFAIPKDLPKGQYLVRIEHIAIHGGTKPQGPEMYFNCAQIEVEGDGTGVPGPLVNIPGVYKSRDPALMFNMYTTPAPTSAPIPGPAVWKGGNSGGNPLSTKALDPKPVPTTLITKVISTPTVTASPSVPASGGDDREDYQEFLQFLRKMLAYFESKIAQA